jgi:ribosome modulation factor
VQTRQPVGDIVSGTYICDPLVCLHGPYIEPIGGKGSDVCWHETAHRRLTWLYGEARANRITLGIDRATQADIAAWNGVGK